MKICVVSEENAMYLEWDLEKYFKLQDEDGYYGLLKVIQERL